MVVSSRKQKNVDTAVEELTKENLDVMGMVCHVGNEEDRLNLINQVCCAMWVKQRIGSKSKLIEQV